MSKKLLTLCMVCDGKRTLLGMKKRGFGAGRWNGFGGKVEDGETVFEAAKRETKEEVGIGALEMVKQGIIDFEFENDPKILEVHIFKVTKFTGEPKETEEMRPEWFDQDKIPFERMWVSDIYWLPLLLQNKKFKARFVFDRPSTADYAGKIVEKELKEVKEI